jgi:quercetin dioxygenase-like cupin family protein
MLAGATDTGGRFALIEITGERGTGPPRHRHHAEDETIYVLAGQVLVLLGEQVRTVSAGECIVLPQGRTHTYRIVSDEARLLVVIAPAGLEASYPDGIWHGDDFERLVAVAARYGIEVTGPPLEPNGTVGAGD